MKFTMAIRGLLVWGLVTPVSAASFFGSSPVYETAPGTEGLWVSDLSANAGGTPSGQFADTFTLGAPSEIGAVTFWGAYFEPVHGDLPDDSLSMRIYTETGGTLEISPDFSASLFNVTREVFIPGGAGAPMYIYTASFSTTILPAGVHGISIVNNLASSPLVWSVGLSQDLSGSAFARGADGEAWTPVPGELGIVIAVPEPSSFALALLAFICLRRRTR